ncbi:MAG TPA: pseudaminic acid synthase [Planctomycetes bacterium]|nr:pseudaminic acid synthase [Planctomycetota bacterium]
MDAHQAEVSPIQIGTRRIGPGQPPYVVAEMSANHGGSFQRARAIVEAAARAGADAVKLQTYTPETLTIDCHRKPFRIEAGPWAGRSLYELYSEAAMPWQWQPRLEQVATDLGIQLFSTPFDASAVDFLEGMDVPAYKIASFELVDLPLLERVARTGKPVLVSTGMATLGEIEEAVGALKAAGAQQIALLKCTSAYPAEPAQMNLRTIPHLAATFGVPVGLSDHSLDPAVPPAAVAVGAVIIEKHFTLSRSDPTPDAAFSLQPDELAALVRAVRTVHQALGGVRYGPSEQERPGRRLRRSLWAVETIRAGQTLTDRNVRSIRPGDGLPPRQIREVLGRKARVDIPRGTPLRWELIE